MRPFLQGFYKFGAFRHTPCQDCRDGGEVDKPVLIAGAGIGGLTTALYLHARGVPVQIYESVSEIRPLGVGINLLPHAIACLDELGLTGGLLDLGIETQELRYFNKFGQEVWQEPRGRAAGLPYPQVSIHRGDLQMLLLAEVEARLGADAVRCSATVESVTSDADGASLTFADAAGVSHTVEGSGIVGADGIHSTVRAQFYPDEGMPIWNGAILWRGLSSTEQFLSGRSMFMAGNMRQKFVAYPVNQQAYLKGESLTNWIAELRYPVTELMEREDWNRPGNFDEFEPEFATWDFSWFNVPELLARRDPCYEFPMVDRDPVEAWTFGCVTLLGDAAHPMYPIGSNGASQAILDARALTAAVVEEATVATAFKRYESERLPPTAAIVRANRGNGPEQVMQLAEERAPNGFTNIEDVVPMAERQAIADQYKQIAGFTAEDLERARQRAENA